MGIQFRQSLWRGIDHDHVVLVLAEFFSQMGAGLAATNDHDAHGSIRFFT